MHVQSLSPVRLCEPMDCSPGFFRLPCSPPGDLPVPRIKASSSVSPVLQADSLPTEQPGKPP